MHMLEYMLVVLSERIRQETGNNNLADDAKALASASHVPEGEEPLAEMHEDWHRRFDRLLRK